MPLKLTTALLTASAAIIASFASWACHSKNDSRSGENPLQASVIAPAPNLPDINRLKAERWADSVMATLTPRQRAAQLFIPRLDITDNAAGYATLKKIAADEAMGGFLLGKGTLASYANLINRGQEYAVVPLLITLDGEWGLSMRVTDAPRFPHNIALGAANDPQLTRAYGREVARECRLVGIQVDFAPVLDVNSNPDNPVIGFRSFSEDPNIVGQLGAAFCMGMADEGVMAVGKHFPGHGDTSTDSHKTLPTVDHSLVELKEIDIKPFATAIDSGMDGIMVAHLNIPALDNSGTPASLSKTVTTDWLQDSIGFKGLIFTDALAMKGAARVGENNCVSALLAGADILLSSANPIADLNAVIAAVNSGKIQQEVIDARCRKLLIHKYNLGLADFIPADVKQLSRRVNSDQPRRIINEISRKCITIVKNNDSALPLSGKRTVVVNLGATSDNHFARECRSIANAECFSFDASSNIPASITSAIKAADEIVVAVFKDSASIRAAFKKLASIRPATCVFIMNPFRVPKFPGLDSLNSIVLAYDNIPQTQTAAAQAIFGRQPVTGRLPVNLPGVGSIGDGISLIP